MDYQSFIETVRKKLQEDLGEQVRIEIQRVIKNNSIPQDSLIILGPGENASPAIYMESFYQAYVEGTSLERLTEQILRLYRERQLDGPVDVGFFTSWEAVRERIVPRLISRERNQQLLELVPHRSFHDLEVVFYCRIRFTRGMEAGILIRTEHLKLWRKDRDEIISAAYENLGRLLPARFDSLQNVMEELLGDPFAQENGGTDLYVLTSRDRSFGAVWITDEEMLRRIGSQLLSDYYILPSSVHECMILPAGRGIAPEALCDMVREINETQIAPDEFLSNRIYYYDSVRNQLRDIPEKRSAEPDPGSGN